MSMKDLRRCHAFPLGLTFLLLTGCGQNDPPDDKVRADRPTESARIASAEEALAGAHLKTLDPAVMEEAEIRNAVGAGPRCEFRYSSWGKPILVARMGQGGAAPAGGVVKLNGKMVLLNPAPAATGSTPASVLQAGPVRTTVDGVERDATVPRASPDTRDALLIFEVGQELKVGYLGYLRCPTNATSDASRT